MGDRNFYKVLKNYAEKTAKFKQIDLIGQLYLNSMDQRGTSQIDEGSYDQVSGGACLSLLMFWLKQRIAGRTPLDRNQGVVLERQTQSLRIASIQIPQQILYKTASRDPSIGPFEARDMVFNSNGLGIDATWKNKMRQGSWQAIQDIINAGTTPSSYHLRVDFAGGGTGHAVGLHRQAGAAGVETFFFDPNVGEYKIQPFNLAKFVFAWKTLVGLEQKAEIISIASTRITAWP